MRLMVDEASLDTEISRRVRERRREFGISLESCAAALGMTAASYAECEAGRARLSAGQLYELSKLLDVEVGYFFESIEPIDGEPVSVSRAIVALVRDIAKLKPREIAITHKMVRAIIERE